MHKRGPIFDTTWCERKTLEEAQKLALKLYDDPKHKRTPEMKIRDTHVGFVGEVTNAWRNDALKGWIRRHIALKDKTDDGGIDFVEEDGTTVGVKTIEVGYACVKVCSRRDGVYPDVYIVYEWDRKNHKIWEAGRFTQSDVHDIMYPNGYPCRGVYVSELV